MKCTHFSNGKLVFPDRIVSAGSLTVENGRIVSLATGSIPDAETIDLAGRYLVPGFIDLHVHGGDGHDVMDGSIEAILAVCRCHARHGTTSLTPTSTVARVEQYWRFLELCAELQNQAHPGARVLGAHLYGPYFVPEAKGCHPVLDFLQPDPQFDDKLLSFAGRGLTTLTVAPELAGCERLVRAACDQGLLVTAGHTYATFPQVEAAVEWGVRHIDHLFCAMSDRARLRPGQSFPMRAGVMEATLFFDALSTEVIADGQHLSGDLLRLAYKIKGPDRLALVTDAMRAVDCPDGEYVFGPQENGEPVRRLGNVGTTIDGKSLASGVMGMDHCIRIFHEHTQAPLHEVIRMATLTPARILGIADNVGSLEVGKRADLVVLNSNLVVEQVYIAGQRVH